jgi:EAL domain-containing protein (putative c-di-GMP-specific phosphodiesterase class I)/FixJ family two-component response regulator
MKKLLVVDDDQRLVNHLGRIIRKYKIEFHYLTESEHFSHTVKNLQPDLIFLDLNMPGKDGVQLLRELDEAGIDTQVYIISGMSKQIVDSVLFFSQQKNFQLAGVIMKPFTESQIKNILESNSVNSKVSSPGEALTPAQQVNSEDILEGIRNLEIQPFYQPRMDLKTNQLVGVEVMPRWDSPKFGEIPSTYFMKRAEQLGLIKEMTWHLLLEVLKDYKTILKYSSSLNVTLNISMALFEDPGFADELTLLFSDFETDLSKFTIEISVLSMESIKSSDYFAILARLRLKGFQLALAGFGTSNAASLEMLYLPINEIKLDSRLINQLHDNEQARVIIQSTIELVRSSQISIVATGVDNKNTLIWLKENGCNIGQGDSIGKAMGFSRLLNYIDRDQLALNMAELYDFPDTQRDTEELPLSTH